jgi:hypothetical protein
VIVCALSWSCAFAHAQDEAPERAIDPGALYARLRPSFVVIRCMGERYGTGFGFGLRGRVATARHVVDCPRSLAAELADGSLVAVRVVAMGDAHDLALLEIVGPRARLVPPIEPRTTAPSIGEDVISVGFPIGPEGDGPHDLAVTRGVVAQRTSDRLIHDALISPGSSGGPVLDREGRVIAVSVAVPSGSSVGLAEPVEHLLELHRETPRDAGDPRDSFDFGLDVGIAYAFADVHPFHFIGLEVGLSASVFDQIVATLRGIALIRFPQTLEEGGVLIEGTRFAGELDFGYRLRVDRFPLVFELAGGLSIGNERVSEARQELMLVDPDCDPRIERCAIRLFGVRTERDDLLARPLLTLRVSLGPLTLSYTALFDVERVEATEHRFTLRLGIF